MISAHTPATMRSARRRLGALAGAIENQQLVLDQDGLGHHRTAAARTGEPGDGRQQMQKQDNQVAHAVIINNLAKSTEC